MGKRGTKPFPKVYHELNGNPGKRDHPDEAEATGSLEAPDWLTGIGLAKWKKLAPHLEEMFGAGAVDSDTLAIYCHHYQEFVSLIDEPAAIEGSQGIKSNPRIAQRNKAADLIRRYGSVLGLSPSDRPGMPAKNNQTNDPVKQFVS